MTAKDAYMEASAFEFYPGTTGEAQNHTAEGSSLCECEWTQKGRTPIENAYYKGSCSNPLPGKCFLGVCLKDTRKF